MKVKKTTDQQIVAETFNEGFVAIAENVNRQSKNNLINDDNNNMDSHTHFMEQAFNKSYPSMEYKCTTMKEIEQIIKSLKKKKTSYGYDEISTKILKISCPFISSPINYICTTYYEIQLESIQRWQKEWENCTKAAITKQYFPTVQERLTTKMRHNNRQPEKETASQKATTRPTPRNNRITKEMGNLHTL